MTHGDGSTPGNGPRFGMIPARAARMRIPGRVHAVLDVIACHANQKNGGLAYLCRDTIAREARIDCPKVSYCTRWLEQNGLVEISGRGGRGLANTYRIIYETGARQTTSVGNGADDGTVSSQTGAENGAEFGQNGAEFGQNGAEFATPTESEQEERTKPPSGESRARGEEAFSNDGGNEEVADRRQPSLFLTINGGGDRKARLAVIKSYNPSPALIERAAELGVTALAEDVFGKWQRHRIANNRLPLDFAAAEADFENWIRDQPRFDAEGAAREAEQPRPRRQHSTPAEDEAAGRGFDKLRALWANGAANG
jgi:hypothetical protein